jgi:GDP-mannose 6-dehydrogenase
MNISIFGLGYVGAVAAGCLAKQGHAIIGVDIHPQKVDALNQGAPPIVEPTLKELLKSAKANGLLHATLSCDEAIAATDVSIVCVGTPSNIAGALDLTFVGQVSREIAGALRAKQRAHTLVLRSTMLPGSTRQLVAQVFADLVADGALRVFYFPEFLRESTAVKDFEQPSLAVVGTHGGTRPPAELMGTLFAECAAVVDWETAEMVKYACNAFHATKTTFANEIGRIGKQVGVDACAVMELLCRDTRLNLSPLYLKPGNPFGGSCLPKDVRALTNHARVQGVNLPLLENILLSNERHLQSLLALIDRAGQREIAILGLTFKAHTDDLRESAMVEVAQALLGRGYQLRIYDPALNASELIGANKRVIDTKLPHLACLLKKDLACAVGQRGLIVAAHKCAPLADLKKCVTPQHHVLDVNGWPELRQLPARYEGFCWS